MITGQFIQYPVQPAMQAGDREQPGLPCLQYTILESGMSERLPGL